jgi:hypothetical protein
VQSLSLVVNHLTMGRSLWMGRGRRRKEEWVAMRVPR